MRTKVVQTKNALMLDSALDEAMDLGPTIPKLVFVTGKSGLGKTTCVAGPAYRHRAVYLRADAVVTLASLLDAICFELGVDGGRKNADRLRAIRAALKDDPRPVIVDEADFLTRDGRMLEVLRDIHDLTDVPVVLIGMDGMERKLAAHPQFARRITQRVEFRPADLEDSALLAKELCEVEVAKDLVARMHRRARGSIGHMVVALTHFESFAKGHRWKSINAEQWGERPMFLGDKGAEQ
jgi:DNA transposition AAA+ family ATPase